VLDNQGNGTESDVIPAIEDAIQLKATCNIRVMNLPVGRAVFESYKQDPLCQAVNRHGKWALWSSSRRVTMAGTTHLVPADMERLNRLATIPM
jgi:hypothetical protein